MTLVTTLIPKWSASPKRLFVTGMFFGGQKPAPHNMKFFVRFHKENEHIK